MKCHILGSTLLMGFTLGSSPAFPDAIAREIVPVDSGWKFHCGDDAAASGESFDDAGWVEVNIPHDWAFEGGVAEDGAQGERGGYYGAGIAWYRTTLNAPATWSGRRVHVEFDGVYMNSEVWINGHPLGKRPYGYISFAYDVTPHIRPGANTLAVRVDNSLEPSARWYHPCGIYAPVRLVATMPYRIARHGVHITTPEIDDRRATVRILTAVENHSDASSAIEIETVLLDPDGHPVARGSNPVRLDAGGDSTADLALVVPSPRRWDLAEPNLYTAVSRVHVNGRAVDEVHTRFGIRSIEWKPETGFHLNNRNVKLRGVCEHLHAGPVGGAWTRDLMRWKLSLLKGMGVNAIRTAHNPSVPVFYELCDEMGILVMDEIFDGWMKKAEHDYGAQAFDEWWRRDLTEWMTRNRNHPSIVLYSVGNETRGAVAPDLVELCHALDPTRPVTSGHSGSEFMDVYGVNGHSERRKFFSEERPDKPFVATEAPHTWQTRGYYRTMTWYRDGFPNPRQDPFEIQDLTESEIFTFEWASPDRRTHAKQHFNSSYDNATVRITARQNWELMRDLPWFSGHFRWTGFDYFGEAGYVHGGWPFRLFMGGALDTAGFRKDLFHFYQSQWTDEPMVHLLPHWTHPTMKPGTKIPVWAYSNAEAVELFHNGRSLGIQRPGTAWNEMQCEWLVPWEPGTVTAIAQAGGREVARAGHRSAGAPARVRVDVESAAFEPNGEALAVVTMATEDADGHFYPYGENRMYIRIDGPARLRSLENGSPVDTDKHVGVNSRRAFMGLTRAFLQSTRESGPVSATVAAILGERRQLTSNLVSIDAASVTLRGVRAPDTPPFEIFYTTDGSEPDPNSRRYTAPFAVEPETTVKARVRRNGEDLFLMEETFAPDAGLHWGGETDASRSSAGMQAESADFSGPVVGSQGSGFHGEGYLDFKRREGRVKWYQENDGAAGPFTLRFRYAANDPAGPRTMDLFLNNRKAATLEFPNTGSWNRDWAEVETVHRLVSGANHIELRTHGRSGPCLDELTVAD